jgi:hypothetical protein
LVHLPVAESRPPNFKWTHYRLVGVAVSDFGENQVVAPEQFDLAPTVRRPRFVFRTSFGNDDGVVTLSTESEKRPQLLQFQAAATTSRHVLIAAARKVRCVRAEARWRWTLKVL